MGTATPSGGDEFRAADASFKGSIPERYEKGLVPLFFEPYAADLRDRIVARAPSRVLEVAAGTGVLTRELAAALPSAWIVATDLNQAMIDVASGICTATNVQFQQADAGSLPFDGASFDLVVAQFGAMFFPDKVGAFREARRVLRGDGAFLFNVWNDLANNPLDDIVCRTFKEETGAPCFLERVPHAYAQQDRIVSDLRAAGFSEITIDVVDKTTTSRSAVDAFDALLGGTPLGANFHDLGAARAAEVRARTIEALQRAFGDKEFTEMMSALVISSL
jgi:ubiquinone/menaquinone biosynthesis C-methylase UbiE